MKTSYLYLRSKLSLGRKWDQPLEHFARHVPMGDVKPYLGDRSSVIWTDPFELLHFAEGETWPDALVLRFNIETTPRAFTTNASTALEPFEFWALVDGNGECFEEPQGGPFSSFMSDKGAAPIMKIFASGNVDLIESVFDQIANDMKCPARRVFHPKEGRVIFIQSECPAKYVSRKFERQLRRIDRCVVTDAQGESEPRNAWAALKRARLERLTFRHCNQDRRLKIRVRREDPFAP